MPIYFPNCGIPIIADLDEFDENKIINEDDNELEIFISENWNQLKYEEKLNTINNNIVSPLYNLYNSYESNNDSYILIEFFIFVKGVRMPLYIMKSNSENSFDDNNFNLRTKHLVEDLISLRDMW